MIKRNKTGLEFEVDKLTNSIENVKSGDSFPTEISLLTKVEVKGITRKTGWQFNWLSELKLLSREVYKLTITNNPNIIQGVVSLESKVTMFICILLKVHHSTLARTKHI